MSVQRVLIIHSTKDGTFDSRLKQISSNPQLDEITFCHVCVLDESRDSARMKEFEAPMDASRQKVALAAILILEVGPLVDEQIRVFAPDVVIVHRGIVFSLVPRAFLNVLRQIKAKYPDVPIAMERKTHWPVMRNQSASTTFDGPITEDEDRWAKTNFVETPEVEAIIKAVFG